jgi:DNA-binding transcriptional MerR regulator
VARRAGTTIRAMRSYEQLGLVVPQRRANGYREYAAHDVRMIEEIRALTALGVPVEGTRPFLECLAEGHAAGDDCPASLESYRRTIDELDDLIARLSARREALAGQLDAASGRSTCTAPPHAPPVDPTGRRADRQEPR